MLVKRVAVPASHSHDEPFYSLFDSGWPFSAPPQRAQQQHRELIRDDGATLEVDLPGVKPSDVEVTVEGNLVKVKYSRGSTGCSLTWQITEAFDIDTASARMEHGVLSLDFSKVKPSKGKRLEIQVK